MKHIDILIVDDEAKFAEMLTRRLTLRGLSCAVCLDGRSALNWIRGAHPPASLILLDLHLTDMYGTQVMAEIKKIDPKIPIVIVTGHGTEADRKACMRLGAHAFANKPLSIEAIIDFLSSVKEVRH